MAKEKTEQSTEAQNVEERVEIFVPKASEKGNNTLFIGINGKGYTLPRGKKSLVPREVAEEFYRSQAAEERRDAQQDSMKTD